MSTHASERARVEPLSPPPSHLFRLRFRGRLLLQRQVGGVARRALRQRAGRGRRLLRFGRFRGGAGFLGGRLVRLRRSLVGGSGRLLGAALYRGRRRLLTRALRLALAFGRRLALSRQLVTVVAVEVGPVNRLG